MKPPLPGFTKITRPKASHMEEDQDRAEDTLALLHQAGDRDNVACLIAAHASDLVISDRPHILKIYTLDRFTVLLRDDQPLTFSGKTQKRPLELLKALIALGGREVGVQTLIDVLWGDADGDAGQNSFNTTLHRLRKLLGEERALVVQDGRLTLSAHYVWVDAWAFSRMLGSIDGAIQIGDGARLEELTNRIFALYRAPFLGDIDAPWAVPMRERLRSRFLQHILQIGDHYGNVQQWRDAVRLYECALEINPLAEDLYRRLMTAYLHLDRRADALRVYQRCEQVLGTSFGVQPSHETRLLCDGLAIVIPNVVRDLA